ncbi:polynucleotide adenylyltransferase PcnB [Polynucleobacter sp. MWH-Spelu-300-X4]|uniref:polynucleotide adenylyltransferase PcnB n=1 Tax=Polynucleobacter sp. MWH-Spelu-300-X4 TaxID=2689109 RepID=UPI001BFDAFAE|nr:polynucleotide adenylyltransferase PcnB [Polynucleobacter sp. MWH-Spelu-300-X4]QWD79513.1 polynucleotide adenylyltransferase PcnB [Polynucleobacter sp. MWH-Spelu-300-X4]
MIRRFIDRIFSASPKQRKLIHGHQVTPKKIAKRSHHINPDLLSKNAVKVTAVLQEAGYDAYIVGGAVRDLLLGIAPKDFDVATDATPEEVQKLFRRSRVIGRRFQIVHVTFYGKDRPEIIEVSTFRAHVQADEAHVAASGRILRDNVWGSQAEDATRRDFTINAMYYDPHTETVLDYHGGMQDIEAKTIRMIGEPTQRYREDPVRMLRAIRFAAKTGFAIEPKTRAPLEQLANLIQDVPSARLFDEILKLLMSGHAWSSISQLQAAGLHHKILPLIDEITSHEDRLTFVKKSLENTDNRIKSGKPVSAGFLFATLLWHDVQEAWARYENNDMPTIPALHAAIDEVLESQKSFLGMQRRHEADMREIWTMQPRLEKRVGRYPFRLVETNKFKAGYDFLLLRAEVGEVSEDLSEWWTNFWLGDDIQRQELMTLAKSESTETSSTNKKRRRRTRSKNAKPKAPEQTN